MKRIILAGVCLALSSCATPYQGMGLTGGVTATRIDETTVEIYAAGNGFTNQETISHYVMRKAAEETLADGYDLFLIVDRRNRSRVSQFTTEGQINTSTTGTYSGYGNTVYGTSNTNGTYTPPQTYNIFKPGEGATIKMFRGMKPTDAPANLFDAHEVSRFMTPQKK